jgi:formylglycine-generating enzyme required for sulfatase activity
MKAALFMSRPIIASALYACCCVSLAQEPPADAPSVAAPGIVRQAMRPQGIEHCVAIVEGWMVPYEETIPGTGVRFTMIPIPGGTFRMGSPEDEVGRETTEGPQFTVTLPPFWIGRCEVTWGEYRTYMVARELFLGRGEDPRPTPAAVGADAVTAPSVLYDPDAVRARVAADRPATGMSQYAARQYTKWISKLTSRFYRLPSESEWEYACRAGASTPWHSGADAAALSEVAWCADNAQDDTHPVGQKPANAWGLHDMHGNVAEWVIDEVMPDGYRRQAGLHQPITNAEAVQWPTQLESRAIRGGAFYDEPPECRSAARRKSTDGAWNRNDAALPKSPHWFTEDPACGLGFRIVRPFDSPEVSEQGRWWEADIESVRKAVDWQTQIGRAASGLVDKEVRRQLEATFQEHRSQKNSIKLPP